MININSNLRDTIILLVIWIALIVIGCIVSSCCAKKSALNNNRETYYKEWKSGIITYDEYIFLCKGKNDISNTLNKK